VTVGPLTLLWRQAKRMQMLPSSVTVSAALAQVGYEKIRRDEQARTVELRVAGMRLDFGTIAKGYATDQALGVLRQLGITTAFVSGGGDTTFGEAPPGRDGWRVALGRTDFPAAPPERVVSVANVAIATSGDLFQRIEIDGVRYSHIVDPRTGLGLTDHSLVSVIASDCVTANGLSTSVSVLGPEEGLALVEATPGAAALVLRAPGGKIERHESHRLVAFLLSTP
jgi:thiamine biosynthesis lipoprotein